ncbi:MAG: gliding motility-associated C-terminal domain-containing protein [Saprospiraceae bacterium]|nr:gliding motility-associated C-terminal domain-containing protein [Saprospiraceae bacterium]
MQFFKQISVVTLFATVATSAAWGQKGSFDLRLSLNSLDCKAGKAQVSIQVKATNDAQTFQMGDANYRFEYNSAQLRNPVIVRQENFSNQAVQVDRNYGQQTLQGSREVGNQGIVSLNAFYTGSNAGAKAVPNVWIPVSTLGFDMVNFQTPIELKWHDNRTFPISGMNQVKINNSDPAAFEYELLEVPQAGQFLNLLINPAASCLSKAPAVAVTAVKTKINQSIESYFPIYDFDEGDIHTAKLLSVSNGTATPSVIGKQLKLYYVPGKDFIGKDMAVVEVSDKFGNKETVTINITVSSDALLVHNGISPNDDGLNDNFIVEGLERFPKHTVAVYDTYGREVLKTNNYKNDWKGTFENKLLPDGTYYYVIENGENDSYTGYLQIQR